MYFDWARRLKLEPVQWFFVRDAVSIIFSEKLYKIKEYLICREAYSIESATDSPIAPGIYYCYQGTVIPYSQALQKKKNKKKTIKVNLTH